MYSDDIDANFQYGYRREFPPQKTKLLIVNNIGESVLLFEKEVTSSVVNNITEQSPQICAHLYKV